MVDELQRRRPVDDRRQAIVEATFHRIAETGFEGLRLRHVATAVGLDHSTLHHYFPTKDDLVTAVVDYATGQFWSTPARSGPSGTLREHLRMMGTMIRERPALFTVLRELDLRATRDPAVRAIVEAREQGWRAALAVRLREGGGPDGLDAALIIAVVKGVSLSPDTAEAVLAQLERLLAPQADHRENPARHADGPRGD